MSDEKTGKGGRRPGSGRKAIGKRTSPVSFECPTVLKEKIQEMAEAQGISTSKFIRNIVEQYVQNNPYLSPK